MPWTGSNEQHRALEQLTARMDASPYAGAADEATLRWFLLDRRLDVDEAEGKVVEMLRWRREFGADLLQLLDVAQEAATGKAYLHTHPDISGRPVIIVRAAKHVPGERPLVESQKLCTFLIDRALERLPPGQDTLLGIFDLRGFTSRNTDLGFVRFLVDIFFTYYPKRLSQVLFVDAPWVFKPGWEIVRPWLKKYAALVRFVSADEARRDYFTPETCPDDFRAAGFLAKGGAPPPS